MLALPILVITTLLVEVSIVESRPRDKGHQGLYDEWKTIPFVDNPDDDADDLFDAHVRDLGKTDTTNTLHEKYQQLYEKYNLENDRTIGDGNNSDVDNVTNSVETVEDEIKLVEGGLDDEFHERQDETEKKKKKNRDGKKKRRHHKSGKREKKLKREKRIKDEDDVDSDDVYGIDIDKFYKEHPHFKTNIATISDDLTINGKTTDAHTTTTEATPVTENTKEHFISESEDDADQKDADDFDEDDDHDDDKNEVDSVSNDESSEEFNYYDYYDEEGDSSYSSSEERAEKEMAEQTSYLFKNYDRMYGDQPVQTENDKSETESETEDDDKKYEIEKKQKENIPKTDVEPSTSPNPPTSKKDAKSIVTQPAYPQWKDRVETWNLIESKPIESCSDNLDCASGRMCKFGLCLCGQPDFCVGHYKPVCGSDGRLYPSHCELHRTACVLGVHIRLGSLDECQPTVVKVIDVESSVSKADGVTVETIETTTSKQINEATLKTNDVVDFKLTSENEFDTSSSEDMKISADNDDNKADHDDGIEIISDVQKAALMNQLSPDNSDDNTSETDEDTSESNEVNDVSDESISDEDDSNDEDDDNDNITNDTFDGKFGKESLGSIEYNDYYEDDDDYSDEYDDDDSDDLDSAFKQDSNSDSMSGSDEEKENESVVISTEDSQDKPSLVPLFCTPDLYLKFKADVLEYHCIYFEELHCDRQTQEEKQRLAAVMFNYYDRDFSGHVEKEELWEMQLREHMDDLSSLCTLLDIATFDELGERDGKLSVDEFIQAFDIPDVLEHKTEIVPLLATVGNGLEIKCDITDSTDVVWKRNDMNLGILDTPGISVLGDGSLYLETIGFHHVGNVCCHDRKKPSIKQIHMLTVQKPPHVIVSADSYNLEHGNSFDIYCHAEGYPKPTINWEFKDQIIQQGAKYHIQTYTNTLTVMDADFIEDSGVYKCQASNTAGQGEATVTINIHNPNVTKNEDFDKTENSFIIFHDNGYTLHEPRECLTQRHVTPEFGNFYFIPDELDAPPSLCEKGFPCIWGGAVNVKDVFVYATQPRENRIVVIDVASSYNPNQVIFTDHTPVTLHYIAHLDEVWVLCWNGESDNGSKTIVIIRNASQKIQHHAIHTQPIGNRFDQVQDYFLPSDSELHHPYMFGYAVHYGQQGLFKVNLAEKKYTRAVDFTRYDCVPEVVAFVPLGGQCLVRCVKRTSYGNDIINILTLDYITDTVIENVTVPAIPYVSPDVRNMVLVEEETGKISVHRINENGKIMHQFDVTINSPVSKGTFHKSSYNHGYDLYLVSKENPAVYSVSLENGKVDYIKDIGDPDPDLFLPWFKNNRPLVSGDVFSDFLGTTATSSMLILNAKHHTIQCDYRDLQNPAVVVYTHLNKT